MYNSISLRQTAATLTGCMGVAPPKAAGPAISQVVALTAGDPVDRLFVYNPDALGMWLYQKYTADFGPIMLKTQMTVPVCVELPSKTPVCFGTMYTGAAPVVHGIEAPPKKLITLDSVFDAFLRAGKKCAVAAVEGSSMAVLFQQRNMDYYILPYDEEVNQCARRLIREDRHDVIVVYNQEYDDVMHETGPESSRSLKAMRNHIAACAAFAEDIETHWQKHRTLFCCLTDHGIHADGNTGEGAHGTDREDDLNVLHFYGVYPRKG